ncbi:hypothetical protein, partial [Patiriisocius marinus]|uniref:hypothetical protein n=1 Tax=Patiriisocius marinus TaxID=1397112 RepID=UPI00232DADD5
TYHETALDAENGTFALTSPYSNIVSGGQIIYARATFVGPAPAPATGCYRVVELELIVNPTPEIPVDLDDILACDPEMDGIEIFDLTENESVIYGTQDPADFTISYYTSLLNAEAGTPAIATPTMFTNTV